MRLDDPPSVRLKVFIGILIGSGISALVWLGFWKAMSWPLVAALVGGKLVAVIACSRVPGYRPVAEGLLISIGVGALIMIGKCATSMEM